MDIIAFLTAGRVERATCHSVDTKDGWMILEDEKGSIIKAISAHNTTHIDFSTPAVYEAPPLPEELPKPVKEKRTAKKANKKA